MKLENILPKNGPLIKEVRKYIEKYNNEIIVIKCGGSVLLEKNLFEQFINDISILNKLKINIIVVHGGGKNIKKKLDEKNIESKFVDGLRVTDEKTIIFVEEALIELNLDIVKKLKDKNCDAETISTKINSIISVSPERKDLKFVGIPKDIDESIVLDLLKNNKVPVVIPMGIGVDNNTYNINADIAAGAIAKKLKSRRLLLMTDVEGVLDKNQKVISEINSEIATQMINDKAIYGGMIPKVNTCLDAVNNGVTGVVIVDGRKPHSILFELFSDKGAGTLIRK
tara:strand:- start:166 stop:1014 length:849 start_codon:yes stop_codon:yes gene_type:complete